MSDSKNKNNNSLFLYTALIFVAAIIIILFAFMTQSRTSMQHPSPSPEVSGQAEDLMESSPNPENPSEPQGIAKTAAELSQENLDLLEENRELNKEIDALEDEQEIFGQLTDACGYIITGDIQNARAALEKLDYASLSENAKILYDYILSNIQ